MKTAAELGLPQEEYDALIFVRDQLRSGAYCYAPLDHNDIKEWYATPKDERKYLSNPEFPRAARLSIFNMGTIFEKADCNSIGCIGGWMGKKLGKSTKPGTAYTPPLSIGASEVERWAAHHPVLEHLFYPHAIPEDDWQNITPAAAADAIDNVLNTGNADWKAVAEAHDLAYDEDME